MIPAADVWTFKIRPGVTFHDGRPLTADDVVYTYKLQANPKNSANALSAFAGVLSPSTPPPGPAPGMRRSSLVRITTRCPGSTSRPWI
jgi:ABC-type transport system substrate-binding protein